MSKLATSYSERGLRGGGCVGRVEECSDIFVDGCGKLNGLQVVSVETAAWGLSTEHGARTELHGAEADEE